MPARFSKANGQPRRRVSLRSQLQRERRLGRGQIRAYACDEPQGDVMQDMRGAFPLAAVEDVIELFAKDEPPVGQSSGAELAGDALAWRHDVAGRGFQDDPFTGEDGERRLGHDLEYSPGPGGCQAELRLRIDLGRLEGVSAPGDADEPSAGG